MTSTTSVLTISPRQITACTALCLLAQEFMPSGKRFGLFVWGDSGIGKNAFTDRLPPVLSKVTGDDYSLVDFNCASRMPEDVAGLPYISKADGNPSTQFAPIYNWTREGGKGVFRIDEMDRPLVKQVIPALLKYSIDRTDDNVLPLDWFVVAQGNGSSDRDTVELSNHTKGRFVHVYASLNSDGARRDMESYLVSRDADPAVQALHRLNPVQSNDGFHEHALHQNRTVEYADALVKAFRTYGDDLRQIGCPVDAVIRPLLAGAVGTAMGGELVRLMDFHGLPTLGQITNNPEGCEVPSDLSLSVKYVTSLCDFASAGREVEQLRKYFSRFPDEVERVGREKLDALFG